MKLTHSVHIIWWIFCLFKNSPPKWLPFFLLLAILNHPTTNFEDRIRWKLEHFFSLSELYQLGWETLPWLLAVAWDCIIGNKVERRLELDVGEIGSLLLRKNELVITTVHNLYFLAYPKNVLQYYLYITSR